LGDQAGVRLLEETLQEEKETNEKLTELSEAINAEAAELSVPLDVEALDAEQPKRKAKSAGR